MWKSIIIYDTQIKITNEKAALIKMPKSSKYEGYVFWHPLTLVRRKGKMYSFSYIDKFNFKLFKRRKGQSNFKNIIHVETVDSSIIEKAFEQQTG